MKQILTTLLLLCAFSLAFAQPKTEEKLIIEILRSLQAKNDSQFAKLFPSFDTLVKYAPKGDTSLLKNLVANQSKLSQYDPHVNPNIIADFQAALKKGKDSGLHWTDMVMARFELERMILKRDQAGIEKLMDMRLQGYIMVEDRLTRKRFVIAVKDLMKIRDKWYGGNILNVLEAENIDDYYTKLAAERRQDKEKMMKDMYASDEPAVPEVAPPPKKPESPLAINIEDNNDDDKKTKRQPLTSDVVERKFFIGTFDKNTKVELYVRGLKGGCPEAICSWQAVYRFQDQDEYLKLEVSKEADGTWVFEEPEIGSMDLKVKGSALVGSWMSFKDRTEYDVTLYEKKELPGKKLMAMDAAIENEE